MSFPATHDAKEQIKNATDIVDLVGGYLELRRQGRNYVGTCPWHDDSRPSLQVNPERQSWKCWVCDIGGDVFSFVMKKEGIEFRESLEMLAERAGIPLSASRGKFQKGGVNDKNALFRVMAWAEQQYHQCLLTSDQAREARDYLNQRGINQESIERFHLGFAPDSWQWMIDRARSAQIDEALLVAVGLTSVSENSARPYDRFRNRLLFSIRDTQSRPVGFGGRILPGAKDTGAKYVNSPETRLFSKSEHLYALDQQRDGISTTGHTVVVEGYTDVIMAWQAGLHNVVAALGTALGERHIRLLRRFADRVTLVLDGDEAGQKRANEILELFVANAVDLRIATLPEGLDPCDFIQQRGAEAFEELVAGAVDALYHKIRVCTAGIDLARDIHGANRALEDVLKTIASGTAQGAGDLAGTQLKQRQLLAHLARQFRIDESVLRSRLSSMRKTTRVRTAPATTEVSAPAIKLDSWDRELFAILISHPNLVEQVLAQISCHHLRSDAAASIFNTYQKLMNAGEPVEFENVLLAVDDVALKNVLVEIDEREAQRVEIKNNPESCLASLIAAYHQSEAESKSRQQLQQLEAKEITPEEQMQVLQNLLEEKRSRQGIVEAPTDG